MDMNKKTATFNLTLTTAQAWVLEIALTRSLQNYVGVGKTDLAVHPSSCIGVQQMILREIDNVLHGRHSTFIQTVMV